MSRRPALKNANDEKVLYYIDKMVSENEKYCRCHRCRLDISAMALNTLPPHYYVDSGIDDDKDTGSPWLLIEVAVRESMEKVFNLPHHQREDAPPGDFIDIPYLRQGTGN